MDLKDFVISGASKRGWTTWLTGAADPRVKAIAPMVIDTLNMPAQMKHQLACYGKFSEMIKDYEDRNLLPMPDTAEAKKLWQMVDPYMYRDKITMPKLIINGANDPYWTVDALNFYWNDLKGEKAVIIVPNAGHNLAQKFDDGKFDPLRSVSRAVNGIAAFTRLQAAGRSMPEVTWQHTDTQDGQLRVTMVTPSAPKLARLWVAKSDSRDFRKSKWAEQKADVAPNGKLAMGVCPRPDAGWLALYGEVDYEEGGLTYSLSTQVRVEKAK
jgi:PhoPQ-activated pathogenicity-related protein